MDNNISEKQQAIDIIQASIYSDPMMDEVQVVRSVLKDMDEIQAAVLLAVAAGVPMELYRNYFSWRITKIVREASKEFLKRISETYGK